MTATPYVKLARRLHPDNTQVVYVPIDTIFHFKVDIKSTHDAIHSMDAKGKRYKLVALYKGAEEGRVYLTYGTLGFYDTLGEAEAVIESLYEDSPLNNFPGDKLF